MRLKDKDRCADLSLGEQAPAVGKSYAGIAGVLAVGAFEILRSVGPGGLGKFGGFQEGCSRRLVFPEFGTEFGHAQVIRLGRFQGYDAAQHLQRFRLLTLLREVIECVLVGADGQLFVGMFQQLSEAELLLPGRIAVAR